ncbi:substrate-binding domain-containing protein [Lentisphaera profundi]|uniref:Substrate-binding domain-containing protein n=1 Tax=Lentisphaera profundi TaxID=1658616 RepID=A0ABY7VT01_9BACT|nr:substrate-binding domain-containing protein [Lentisphaera profundi]WDE95263.1 substrate-binding domain-containing protein [Lentisphaera profundi]
MPGYKEVAQTMEQEIKDGKYEERLPTIDGLCDIYKVSRVTMQRAIGVLKKREVVNTSPKRGITVTRLKRPRSHVLGAVLHTKYGSPLHEQLIEGMYSEAEKFNEVVAVSAGTLGNVKKEVTQIKQLLEKQKVDGFVIWPSWNDGKVSPGVQYLIDEEIPFVVVPDDFQHQYRNCNLVTNRNDTGSSEVMTHLLGSSYKNILFVTKSTANTPSFTEKRYEQYKKSLGLANLKTYPIMNCKALAKKRKVFDGIDAVFCDTDECAIELVKICLQKGVSIPSDIALVGYDNTKIAHKLDITSIEQHFGNLGRLAIDVLLRDINGELEEKEHHTVQSELIIRNSSKR